MCILYAHLTVRCRFSAFFFLSLALSLYLFCVLFFIWFTCERVCTAERAALSIQCFSSSSQSKWKWISRAIEMSEKENEGRFFYSVFCFCVPANGFSFVARHSLSLFYLCLMSLCMWLSVYGSVHIYTIYSVSFILISYGFWSLFSVSIRERARFALSMRIVPRNL